MGIFNLFKKKTEPIKSVKKTNDAEIAEFAEKKDSIFNEFKEKTAVQSIKLTAKRGQAGITGSKFGGVPCFPKNFEYPHNKQGIPLRLLAQLNLDELPKLDNFPQKGILQFFISEEDLGLDFNNPPEIQNNYRVIYHENILPESELENNLPEFSGDEFPFGGEFMLSAQYESRPMSVYDFRFGEEFMEIYKKHINTQAEALYNFDDAIVDEIYKEFDAQGHRISGYPAFTQEDPRGYQGDYSAHTVTLFQMDSDTSDKENQIMWGDMGVANFFISPEKLSELDFSDVLYNWDCC